MSVFYVKIELKENTPEIKKAQIKADIKELEEKYKKIKKIRFPKVYKIMTMGDEQIM